MAFVLLYLTVHFHAPALLAITVAHVKRIFVYQARVKMVVYAIHFQIAVFRVLVHRDITVVHAN